MEINKKTIQPVGKYLLLEVEEQKETSSGLLLAEDGGYTLPTAGTVLKAGPEAVYKSGDTLIFRKYSADEIKVTTAEKEEKYWLLEDDQVIAVVAKDNETKDKYEQIKIKKGAVEPLKNNKE